VTYSALTGQGIAELWNRILEHREKLTASGEFARRRREQQVKWMWTMLDDRLFMRLKTDPALRARLPALEAAVAEGRLSPALAVDEIAQAMGL
jgi:LAO/AO transport system kinase